MLSASSASFTAAHKLASYHLWIEDSDGKTGPTPMVRPSFFALEWGGPAGSGSDFGSIWMEAFRGLRRYAGRICRIVVGG